MADHDSRSPGASSGETDDENPGRLSIVVTGLSVALTALFWLLDSTIDGAAIGITFLFFQVVLISIVIWQACDPFADAAQWIGTTLRIPGSVRGATLDAVASSMPELFSGIFFVVVAVLATDGSAQQISDAGSEGFGATVATCAGSAVYNMILIPAFCALFISFYRPERPTIDIEDQVISRDGLWFLGTQIVLIYFLYQEAMHWWMAVVLLALYGVYIVFLYRDARSYQRVHRAIRERLGPTTATQELIELLAADGVVASRALIEKVRNEMFFGSNGGDSDLGSGDSNGDAETAGLLFGRLEVRLTGRTAWGLIAGSTIVAAVACYWLVEVTHETAKQLDVPIFFVAVILAAAASSVPDTFLSIGAAKRGDDDGAVSNAFGSNIFDICICLTIPLLIGTYLNDWQPILMVQNGQPIPGINDLRILLCGLTLVTLLIMWHNRQLTRRKALVLCALYAVFVGYAVAGSLGYSLFDFAA